jgi:hypothetical protein
MSKSRIGMAAACVAMVALGALPSAAEAGFRLRVGGPAGVARFAMARMLSVAGLRHARMAARHSRVRTAALRPQDLRSATESVHPSARAQLTAVAALAGWQGRRAAQGWRQHADGSYGWVGPLFWPFAYSDLYDYALLSDGSGFWPMATAISTPRSSRLTLPAISQRSRPSALPGGGIAKRPPCRSSAALTPPR